VQRSFINILSENVAKTADFYQNLLGMKCHFAADWFIILTHDDIAGLELGILQKDHETVPEGIRSSPAGMIVTFVVEDCDKVHEIAVKLGANIIQPPTDMFYGQRRMLVSDPEGTVLDISAPTAAVSGM